MSDLQAIGIGTAAPPATSGDLAASMIAGARGAGGVDTGALNRELAALARTDPALATQTRAEIEGQLTPVERGDLARPVTGSLPDGTPVSFDPEGMEQGRWIDAVRTSANPADRATYDRLVAAAGSTDPQAIKTVLADAYARGIAPSAIGTPAIGAAGNADAGAIARTADTIDPLNRLGGVVQSAAAGIGGDTQWGGRLQTLLGAVSTANAFREGVNQGILEGGKDMVVGVATLAGRGAQLIADSSLSGRLGDALRGATGPLPGWADAIVPSAERGAATRAAIGDTASAIGGYIASRATTEGLLAADITKALDGAWDSLKAGHAAAAAQGPEAEARWFGQAVGRVGFEVASTFVPVAGIAGKVDKAADGLRAAEGLADAARTAPVFSRCIREIAERLNLSPEGLQRVLDMPKGERPDPLTYLPPERIAEHASAFEAGASRFTLQSTIDKYGLGQRDGTSFVMTRAEADRLIAESGGDPRKLEAALGLPAGQLDSAALVRVDFKPEAMERLDVRIPTGNEAGANDQWLPGGLLPSGVDEAVIDGARAVPSDYTITEVR